MTTAPITLTELRTLATRHGARLHVDAERRQAYVRIAQVRYVATLSDDA